MLPHIDDRQLRPVAEKVEAGERLDYRDGLVLYRSSDLLTVGYLANRVRERLNGNITYFNVNRHINPTDMCVAACKLCAFGKQVRDPRAYTMSLEQVWHVHDVVGAGLARCRRVTRKPSLNSTSSAACIPS